MIKFEHIVKRYKTNTVISDISFEIEKGDFVVLVGKSGSGKTTTLKMINRLIKPSDGKILIKGKDIAQEDLIRLRRNMGYVIQQTGLFPHMTTRENIELIPKLEKQDKNKIIEKTFQLLDMVGMDHSYLDRYPSELSGGQQQRVGVARAFALDPEIILMDEPFSALDPITREALQDELSDLQSQLKKTIVFVTHDMDEAIKIADKICLMDEGKIVQYDTPENILKNPANDFVSDFVGKKRIWSSPEYIKAEDIMLENPVTCFENFTIFKAMEKMRIAKVDSLMVIEPKTHRLLGVLTAKFIRGIEDKSKLVRDVMKKDMASVKLDDNIVDILTLVNEISVSSIPVLDDQQILLGLITKGSLVTTLSQQYIDEEGGENNGLS
ncbi:MAG: ABC transporter ATP-binding protein [Breznakia sp.]